MSDERKRAAVRGPGRSRGAEMFQGRLSLSRRHETGVRHAPPRGRRPIRLADPEPGVIGARTRPDGRGVAGAGIAEHAGEVFAVRGPVEDERGGIVREDLLRGLRLQVIHE